MDVYGCDYFKGKAANRQRFCCIGLWLISIFNRINEAIGAGNEKISANNTTICIKL